MLFGLARGQFTKVTTFVATLVLLLASCGSAANLVPETAVDAAAPAEESPPEVATPTEAPAVTVVPSPTEAPIVTVVPAPTEVAAAGDGLFPTVVDATASTSDGMGWTFAVTLLSEYDSPERYADAWRVLDADDNELGIRVLGHDHANEQPFTRTASVDVPVEVATVFIEGRDQVNGWSGERFLLDLPR